MSLDHIREKFSIGVRSMRAFEDEISVHSNYFKRNVNTVAECVHSIVKSIN